MSLDNTFIRAVLEKDCFADFKTKIPEKDFFEDPGAANVWEYITTYHGTYAKTPSMATIEAQFEGMAFPAAPEDAAFYYDRMEQKFVHSRMSEIATLYSRDTKNTQDYKLSLQKLYERIVSLRQDISSSVSITKLFATRQATWNYYLSAKAGEFGIPTPWQTMNKWTRGFYPKDLSFVVGRTGLGKSWIMLLLARAARLAGKKVMIISCEMSREDMQHRFFCIDFQIPYGAFRNGALSLVDEQRLKQAIEGYDENNDIEIQDGSQGLEISDIENCIMRTEAELILIDSAYRIRSNRKTKDRFDNMAFVADDIKLFAQIYNKSIIASVQLNRTATSKKTEELGTEDIALSDVIGWNSTNIFAIGQEKTDDDHVFMKIIPVKVREGQNGKDFMKINWNFVGMDFNEVADPVAQAYSNQRSSSVGFGNDGADDDDDDVDAGRW